MATVQIDRELLLDLMRYHLAGLQDPDAELRIRKALQEKLDAMVRRDLYTRSKTDPSPAERERARQAYLDQVGIPEDFRWPQN